MGVKNYTFRVGKLKERRQGSNTYAFDSADFATGLSISTESYQERAQSDSLQYALGAMQEVDVTYTRVSHEEKDRVTRQLISGLTQRNQSTSIELQGSLAINIHLRRYSDVDLLVLPSDFYLYNAYGPAASTYSPSSRDRISVVKQLRTDCYNTLRLAYPKAEVNNTGAKSIAMTGGSLQRKIDVVPSLWNDTAAYQTSRSKEDRGVEILDLKTELLTGNFPFKYMEEINRKDVRTYGGTKKAIRLLKSLKYDADVDVALSSFDIASLVWNMQDYTLTFSSVLETALIASVQLALQSFCDSRELANSLYVADSTRKIIRTDKDFIALLQLNQELIDLIDSIATELNANTYPSFERSRQLLNETRL
jgi:hypothetical protein